MIRTDANALAGKYLIHAHWALPSCQQRKYAMHLEENNKVDSGTSLMHALTSYKVLSSFLTSLLCRTSSNQIQFQQRAACLQPKYLEPQSCNPKKYKAKLANIT